MVYTNHTGQGRWGKGPVFLGLLLILTTFVFLFGHFWYSGYVEFDSFTNATIGFHISEGKALYTEVWGSKPPGIYFLDALFISVFGISHSSIWIAQIVSGIFLIAFFFLVVFKITDNVIVSWLATFLFMILFYFSVIYQGGNLTEEYGVFWILAGWIGILAWYYEGFSGGLWIGGAAMCMSLWFKEPFLFSVTPAGIWLIIHSFKHRDPAVALKFIGGALIPVTAFFLYFISSNTLDDYIAYFYYTSAYSGFTDLTLIEKIGNSLKAITLYFGSAIKFWHYLILLAIPGIIYARGKSRVVLIVLIITLILEVFSVSLSGYTFQHYFFQIIPTFYLCVFVSLSVILDKMRENIHKGMIAVEYGVLSLGLIVGFYQVNDFWQMEKAEPRNMELRVIHELNELKGDKSTLYVEDPMYSHLYVRTRMVSTSYIPVPVFHFFMVPDKFADTRFERFVYSMKADPPEFIVTSHVPGVLHNIDEMENWFPENYDLIYTEELPKDTLKIWLLKDNS